MTPTTEEELKSLLKQYETDPLNLDLINSIAIGYFENYVMNEDKEDYDYDFFEKAYLIKKTVKSTHNFAWFLYFECSVTLGWDDKDLTSAKAFEIQKECIDLNPKSYMPYYQYGFMLLEQNQNEKAIEYLIKANSLNKNRDIINNIGYCYFKIGNYEKARFYFLEGSNLNDDENVCLYNLALTEYKLGNFENLKIIAKKLEESIDDSKMNDIDGYDIAILYFLLDDLNDVYNCLINEGIDNLNISGFKEIFYALNIVDKDLWIIKVKQEIKETENNLFELINNPEEAESLTEDEKQINIEEYKKEIEYLTYILSNGLTKPEVDFSKELHFEHCGCLLFDCKRHENIDNDY